MEHGPHKQNGKSNYYRRHCPIWLEYPSNFFYPLLRPWVGSRIGCEKQNGCLPCATVRSATTWRKGIIKSSRKELFRSMKIAQRTKAGHDEAPYSIPFRLFIIILFRISGDRRVANEFSILRIGGASMAILRNNHDRAQIHIPMEITGSGGPGYGWVGQGLACLLV